jgi:acylphosphatase
MTAPGTAWNPSYGEESLSVPCRITFAGRVQGVGFRIRTKSLADRCGAAGTVRNLVDGTVELCLVEPADAARRLVRELQGVFADQIDGIRIDPWEPQSPIREFQIAR